MLLATAYLPPLEYFAAIAAECLRPGGGDIWIDGWEHYHKQTWRNRFRFLSAAGAETLGYPVIHSGDIYHTAVRDILIDWSVPWALKTRRALDAAYGASAFYEYYKDGLYAILDSRPARLFDLNTALTEYLLSKIGIPVKLKLTEEYVVPGDGRYGQDLREVIHPKRPNSLLRDLGAEKPYFQVFSCKYGFTPGLSAIDLLFNEGPEAASFLEPPAHRQHHV